MSDPMNDYATTPNDIDTFASILRDVMPRIIEEETDREVFQQGDDEEWTGCRAQGPGSVTARGEA